MITDCVCYEIPCIEHDCNCYYVINKTRQKMAKIKKLLINGKWSEVRFKNWQEVYDEFETGKLIISNNYMKVYSCKESFCYSNFHVYMDFEEVEK